MKQISYYYGLPTRIFILFLILTLIGFLVFKSPILGNIPEVIPFALFFLILILFKFYVTIKACDVSCDGTILYFRNLLGKDQVSVNNIQHMYHSFLGFEIVFKVKTKLGKKIFFITSLFQKEKLRNI